MEYQQIAEKELKAWQRKMSRRPSIMNKVSKKVQVKLNSYIPEKIHTALTTAIRQMVRAVLFGATYTTSSLKGTGDLNFFQSLILCKRCSRGAGGNCNNPGSASEQ